MFILNVRWLTNALQVYFLFKVTKIKVHAVLQLETILVNCSQISLICMISYRPSY